MFDEGSPAGSQASPETRLTLKRLKELFRYDPRDDGPPLWWLLILPVGFALIALTLGTCLSVWG